jgi:hypothetical protein
MGSWMNDDGLYVKFGTDEAAVTKAGEVPTAGSERWIEVDVTLTDLSTSAETILSDTLIVPKNARIEEIQVVPTTAATSGGSATLDIGLIRTDRETELDYDGFVAAAALSTFNAVGERLTLVAGSTAAGALIGTSLANPGLLTAGAGTAVFTAGVVKVRVKYFFL